MEGKDWAVSPETIRISTVYSTYTTVPQFFSNYKTGIEDVYYKIKESCNAQKNIC